MLQNYTNKKQAHKNNLLQESGESLINLKAYRQEMYEAWER